MKKILIVSNNDVGLYKFRKELIERLVENNEVYISLPNGEFIKSFEDMGCKFVDTPMSRRGTNPIKDFKLLMLYRKIINIIKPDVVLTYTIKPNIYAGLICKLSNISYIANVTGLGTAVENNGWLGKVTLSLYKVGLEKASCIFFQNGSNKNFFELNKIIGKKTRLIPGSGVNLNEHKTEEYPLDDGTIRILFIGRIMEAKGIDELLIVAERLKALYDNISFDLVGFSEGNYSLKLIEFEKKGIIKYHGQQSDVHSYIKKSHATILPSHHEGLANVLLETASTARPVLASRIPGCIEAYDENISGFGFEARNIDSLEEALIKFINLSYVEKKEMGVSGRKKMEKEFDRNIVIHAYLEEIDKVK